MRRLADPEELQLNVVFPFESKKPGQPSEVWIPESRLKDKSPSELKTLAERTYEAFRRAEEWEEQRNIQYVDEKTINVAKELYKVVFPIVTVNCATVYTERLSIEDNEETRAEECFLESLVQRLGIDGDLDLSEAAMKSADVLFDTYIRDDEKYLPAFTQNLYFWVSKQLAAAAILQADEETDGQDITHEAWGEVFERHYKAEINGVKFLFQSYAYREAADILENDLKPVKMPLKELRLWAGVTYLESKANHAGAQVSGMVVATSKLAGHLNGFIVSRKENHIEELQARRNGHPELVRAYSRLDLPKGIQRPSTTELLEKMHKTLLKRKEESASLLKTHLYLVDRAYKRGGDSPTFTVNMDELLEAKGYTRRADGSFQASTYREEWGRIATLAGCWLELRRVKEKNKRGKEETFVDETPYWDVRARRRLEEGEALGLEVILLEDPEAPIIKAVVIQPGLWWGISDRGTMNFHLPHEVLTLPTDGKGNETQRMAVQIAATLALWVRSAQNQHAGKEWSYGVGTLLEASGVRTRLEFDGMNRVEVGRLRKYLAGTPDEPGGVIQHLVSLGAFDIRIRDEEAFWASGRGWQTRFWESQLTVKIPDLKIKKLGKPRTKRPRAKQALR